MCVLAFTSGYAISDDTDVFFGSAAGTGETRPNVLLVLDTSGSMGARDELPQSRLERMKDAVKSMLQSDIDMNIGLMKFNGVYGGGPVLYPVTALDAIVCEGTDCKTPTAADNVYLVDGNYGDVEQRLVGGSVDVDDDTLNFGHDGFAAQAVGLRYAGINIARGATILDARLEFVAVSTDENAAEFLIRIEDAGDSEAFDERNNGVSDRTYQTGGVAWDPDEWYEGTLYESPDVKDLVQSNISRDDWCTGNAMTFSVSNVSGSTGERRAYSHERAVADGVNYIPQLRIVQDPATGVSEDDCVGDIQMLSRQVVSNFDNAEQNYDGSDFNERSPELDLPESIVGVRFRDINIPKDTVIDSAFIRFTSFGEKGGSLDLRVHAEERIDPPTYEANNGPANRALLSESVSWNNLPVLTTNQTIDSPDLKSIVQRLVSDSDWEAGNAMAFQLRKNSGGGRRGFISHRRSPAEAAQLFISYSAAGNGSGTVPVGPTQPFVPSYSTSTARDEMLEIVDGLTAAGGTPGVDSYYEAALYMRGEPVDFGKTRGASSTKPARRERFRISHPNSYTGGSVSRDPQCTDANLTSSACRYESIIGSPIYTSPITGSCQANHIVLLSDGETDRNDVTSRILTMIDKTACTEIGDTACATDLATWLNTTDHSSTLDDVQKIKTHTIAFNLEGAGKSFMQRIAIAGGGSAYEADTSDELLDVFNNIATSIAEVDTSFTAPAATVDQSNRLTHRDDIYFSLFKPSASPTWDGNIKRFRVGKDSNGNGEVVIRDFNGVAAIDESTGFFADHAQSWWPEKNDAGLSISTPDGSVVARGGAANQITLTRLAGTGDRNVYTWIGDSGTTITTPVDLTATDQQVHESNELISDEVLNIVDVEADADDQSAYRESLLQWARGVDVDDSDKDGITIDVRRHMGDPLHSQPVIVNYASDTEGGDVRSLVFVGTNEGYLHAIDTSNGQEQFAFIPNELLGNLNRFKVNATSLYRLYGLDGPLSVWRQDDNENLIVDSDESAYLFVGMRRGGSSYYALNITDPDKPKLAWTIQGGPGGSEGFASMGQSWSRLTPVKMFFEGQAEDVLIFGGGYDVNQDRGAPGSPASHTTDSKGTGIYIVKATTGELLWSGLGTATGGAEFFTRMEYGFNSHIRAIDINRDDYIDQMYAADAGGQLWRFDVTQYHSDTDDELITGDVIADFSGSAANAHRRFYNEPDVALIEGGGERFLSISIGSGWRANPLEEVTHDRFYMVKQYAVYEEPNGGYGKRTGTSSYGPITDSDLVDVTSTLYPATNLYGWFLDFPSDGEKVLGTSVTFDGKVIFSTYVPTQQVAVCSPAIGSGRAYIMDVSSGAPVVDLDQTDNENSVGSSTVLTLSDRSTELNRGGIPPQVTVLITADSPDQPQIFFGGEQLDTGIQNNTRRTFWSDLEETGEIKVIQSER